MKLLVLAPILAPLITAALCLLAWQRMWLQRAISLLGGVVFTCSSVALLGYVYSYGIVVMQPGNWPAPFGITLVADLFSAVMAAVGSIVGLAVLIFSLTGVDQQRQQGGFHPLLHTLLLGVSGSFLTGDLFNLYVWFEVMLISSFVLVSLGGEKAQLEGAIKYVTLNLLSSALFLAAVGVLYSTVGTLNLADLAVRLGDADPSGAPSVAGRILLIAFGIKAAVFPLFFWLPASYHTPPAAISAVLAGLLTKVGVYAMTRVFSLLFPLEGDSTQTLLLWTAGLTMATGVLGAAAQNDIRRVLSFHIISQIGYMIMGLAMYTPLALAGMVFYLVHHIVVKTNLFLVAGIVQRLRGTCDLDRLGGLYRDKAWLAFLFLIPAFSLAGLPPLSGFWAKFILARAGLEAERYLIVAVALAVSLLTLFSMTKVWAEAFWKVPPAQDTPATEIEGSEGLRWMVVPSAALASLTVAIGFAAEPLFELASATANQLLDPKQYIDAVLGGA